MLTCSNNEMVHLYNDEQYTVELQWLKHLWNYENMLETKVVPAKEC